MTRISIKKLSRWGLEGNIVFLKPYSENGSVLFNELLYRSMKRIYGEKEFKSDIMRITEF
jgi:hypothetical protein